jgi:hypothetical protein
MGKKLLIAAAAVTIVGIGAFGVKGAVAQDVQNGYTSLIQKIADKFHLNKDDVKAVFDQERADRMKQMETQYEARLDQLVKDGKINDAQKQLILAKHKELIANRQSAMQNFKTMTPDQRKAAMDQQHQDLQNWAKQNNIPLQYLMGGRGMGMMGKGHWKGW